MTGETTPQEAAGAAGMAAPGDDVRASGPVPRPLRDRLSALWQPVQRCLLSPLGCRVRLVLAVLLGVLSSMAAAVSVLLFFNIEENPIVGGFVRDRLVAALQERIDPALKLTINKVDLRRDNKETIVFVSGFRILDAGGKPLVVAPTGRINLKSTPLLLLRLVPTAVNLAGLRVAVELSEKGEVIVDPLGEEKTAAETPVVAAATDQPALERMQELIGGAFASLTAARDAVGGRLPAIGIDDAAVSVLDRRTGRRHDLNGIVGRMTTAEDGKTTAQAEIKTASGPFALTLELAPRSGDRQSLTARTDKLDLHDIAALAGVKVEGVDLKTPLTVAVSAEVDRNKTDGGLKAVSAAADISLGRLSHALDKNAAPITLDETHLALRWAQGDDRITITGLSSSTGKTAVRLAGEVKPPVEGSEDWKINLKGAGLPIEPLASADKPFALDNVAIAMSALPGRRTLTIDDMTVNAGGANLHLTGKGYLDANNKPGLELGLEVNQADARAALRLWPNFSAPLVRKWLVDHLRSGRLETLILALNFPPDVFEAALDEKPLPADSLMVNWRVSDVVIVPVPGLPPVRGVVSRGDASGQSVQLALSGGVIETSPGRRLTIADGHFSVPDINRKPADARLRLRFSGGVDALAEFMRNPAVQSVAPKGIDPALVTGAVEGETTIAFRLVPQFSQSDPKLTLNASLRNVTLDKAFGKERLENGTLQLALERDQLQVKGEARLFGLPVGIEVKGAGKAPPVATLTMMMDDAARARRGMDTGGTLSGPVQVKIAAGLEGGGEREFDLDLDFARASFSDALPGLSKKAGVPARGRAHVKPDGAGWLLERLEFESGQFSARGTLALGQDGSFQRANLTSLKFASGDNMQLEADRSAGVLRLNLKGNSLDARGFIKALQVGTADKAGGRDAEITLRSTVLSGFNGELIANADMKMSIRSGGLRRFDLTGRLDGGGLTAQLKPGASGQSALVITSADAGAFLRFMDLYNRMRSGSLDLVAQLGSGRQAGNMKVKGFHLRDEPAIRRLVTDVPNSGGGESARLDADFVKRMRAVQDIPFERMELAFVRTPGRFDIREATLYGPDIGGNLSGVMDYARDLVDLTGTFVPAYTLNNFFAKVPVLGPFLGGGKNEGLFAVRYNITGRLSAPTLSVNPLTALAPGFLRKLIDVRGMTGAGQ